MTLRLRRLITTAAKLAPKGDMVGTTRENGVLYTAAVISFRHLFTK